jgi:hypothetical protein
MWAWVAYGVPGCEREWIGQHLGPVQLSSARLATKASNKVTTFHISLHVKTSFVFLNSFV